MEFSKVIEKTFFSSAAFYISEDFIDVAEANSTPGGMNITSLQRFPINKDIADSVDIHTDVTRIFGKAFPDKQNKPIRIAVNVRNKQLILRRFAIRNISRAELNQAVIFEAQKYIPSLIDSLTYGFRVQPLKQNVYEIVFAAAETKNIHEVTDCFTDNGVLPAIVEPVPVLLARSLALKKGLKKDGSYVFIHYEPSNRIILCEISHRYPYFFREIVVNPEKERFAGPDGEMRYPTLSSIWPLIEKDVIGGMDYLRKEANEKIEKIIISGFEYSSDEDNISKEFGVPFVRPDLSFFSGISEQTKDRYLPVLMLLYDSQKTPFFNIAPESITKSDLWPLKRVLVRSIGIFLLIILAHFFFAAVNAKKSAEVAVSIKKMQQYGDLGTAMNSSDVAVYKEDVLKKADFANRLAKRKHYLTEKLLRLGEVIPPGCWVTNINYKNELPDESMTVYMSIKGMIFDTATPGAPDGNKLLEAIKGDRIAMDGFRDAEIASLAKKEYYGKEITEFEIVLK